MSRADRQRRQSPGSSRRGRAAPAPQPAAEAEVRAPAAAVQRLLASPAPHAADVLALQRSIGNRAVQRVLAISGAAPAGLVQLAPLDYKNTQSVRNFKVSNIIEVDGRIDVKESRLFGTKHSGYLTYEVIGKDFLVHHVESDPREGSGIGSLLMYLAALKAGQLGLKTMTLSKPANTAHGFYTTMGFDFTGKQEAIRQRYIAAGRAEDIPPVIAVPSVTADLFEVHLAAAASAAKRWKRIDEDGSEQSI
jgi:hypothetical protein